MQQKRILIILVVVLVVIFIVGVVRGPTQGGNNSVSIDKIQNGFLGTLHNLFKPPHLVSQDVRGPASCFNGNNLSVNVGSTCNYIITEHTSIPVRNVNLNFKDSIFGQHATLTLVPTGAITVTLGIPNPPPNKTLVVYGKGGQLMVTCDGTVNCLLLLN